MLLLLLLCRAGRCLLSTTQRPLRLGSCGPIGLIYRFALGVTARPTSSGPRVFDRKCPRATLQKSYVQYDRIIVVYVFERKATTSGILLRSTERKESVAFERRIS